MSRCRCRILLYRAEEGAEQRHLHVDHPNGGAAGLEDLLEGDAGHPGAEAGEHHRHHSGYIAGMVGHDLHLRGLHHAHSDGQRHDGCPLLRAQPL